MQNKHLPNPHQTDSQLQRLWGALVIVVVLNGVIGLGCTSECDVSTTTYGKCSGGMESSFEYGGRTVDPGSANGSFSYWCSDNFPGGADGDVDCFDPNTPASAWTVPSWSVEYIVEIPNDVSGCASGHFSYTLNSIPWMTGYQLADLNLIQARPAMRKLI